MEEESSSQKSTAWANWGKVDNAGEAGENFPPFDYQEGEL